MQASRQLSPTTVNNIEVGSPNEPRHHVDSFRSEVPLRLYRLSRGEILLEYQPLRVRFLCERL